MIKKEILDSMRVIFGKNVVCTDGLYHIFTGGHNELYINAKTMEMDSRCKYNTLVVMDHIIVTKVIGIKGVNFVVLDKENLDCIYKTNGQIVYLNENIVYDKCGDKVVIISHTGRILQTLNGIQSIEVLDDNKYLVKSKNSFNDTILMYRRHPDLITCMAKNKRYLIYKSRHHEDAVEVLLMQGGKFLYKFKTNECINMFTDKIENIQLFDVTG